MGALDYAVRSGKALYAGISSYTPEQTLEAARILKETGHAAAHPPAQLFHAQPLDRERFAQPLRSAWTRWARDPSRSRRWPRGCSPTGTSTVVPADSRAAKERFLSESAADRGKAGPGAWLQGHRRRTRARPWPRWPSPGSCASSRRVRPVTSALVGRVQRRTAGGHRLSAINNLDFTLGGTDSDRRVRRRIRHQSVGAEVACQDLRVNIGGAGREQSRPRLCWLQCKMCAEWRRAH